MTAPAEPDHDDLDAKSSVPPSGVPDGEAPADTLRERLAELLYRRFGLSAKPWRAHPTPVRERYYFAADAVLAEVRGQAAAAEVDPLLRLAELWDSVANRLCDDPETAEIGDVFGHCADRLLNCGPVREAAMAQIAAAAGREEGTP